VGYMSRSSGLLHVEASLARVVHVAPSWRLRRSQVEDGQVNAMG
jgi:hypothetical protein